MSPTNFFAFKLIIGLHVRVDLWDVTVLKFPYSAKSLIKNSGQILQHSALFTGCRKKASMYFKWFLSNHNDCVQPMTIFHIWLAAQETFNGCMREMPENSCLKYYLLITKHLS